MEGLGNSILEKATVYDRNGLMKAEIDNAIGLLRDFRVKFPFVENPDSIDSLGPDEIFKVNPDGVGEFFHYLEYRLKPLGHLTIHGSNVYYKIRLQIEDFKDLLRIAVDTKKSLAEKVDAPWEEISGLGGDKHIAKKIIFCFNYESSEVLSIFSTNHLKYFFNKIVDKPISPTKYFSLGDEYEYLTSELLEVKDNLPITQPWEIAYFSRFLYNNYPPPDTDEYATNKSGEGRRRNLVTKEQLELGEFVKLLGDLQRKGKMTGEQFRQNRELWMNLPQDRENLTQRLKTQLN